MKLLKSISQKATYIYIYVCVQACILNFISLRSSSIQYQQQQKQQKITNIAREQEK